MSGNRDTGTAQKMINWSSKPGCGKGLRIGLIDTGVNREHPALKGQSIIEHSVLSQGIKKAAPDHGTAIATLLVGHPGDRNFSGLLPAAKLFSVSVFRQRDKRHTDTTAEWIIGGIDWLLSQQVQAINMSIGGPRNLLVDVAIQRTIQSGVTVIAAAGNNGTKSVPVYPAAQPGVIAVTAVDGNMRLYRKASHGAYIDFAAPGVDIWTASEKRGGKFVSGTSFATPFVTANMASLARKNGPRKAYENLQRNARDLGTPGKDNEYGWGLVQAKTTCM
jgi:subtilisin family serine protease